MELDGAHPDVRLDRIAGERRGAKGKGRELRGGDVGVGGLRLR